jgi:hypothetical protein
MIGNHHVNKGYIQSAWDAYLLFASKHVVLENVNVMKIDMAVFYIEYLKYKLQMSKEPAQNTQKIENEHAD